MRLQSLLGASALVLFTVTAARVDAAKLVSVGVLDKDYLVVQVLDGEVEAQRGRRRRASPRYTPELEHDRGGRRPPTGR